MSMFKKYMKIIQESEFSKYEITDKISGFEEKIEKDFFSSVKKLEDFITNKQKIFTNIQDRKIRLIPGEKTNNDSKIEELLEKIKPEIEILFKQIPIILGNKGYNEKELKIILNHINSGVDNNIASDEKEKLIFSLKEIIYNHFCVLILGAIIYYAYKDDHRLNNNMGDKTPEEIEEIVKDRIRLNEIKVKFKYDFPNHDTFKKLKELFN